MPNGKEEKEPSAKRQKIEKIEKMETDSPTKDSFEFNALPRDIRQLIFQFFSPDKHKMTDINRVSKEWNTLSQSDFMVLKYCKRTPESGWEKFQTKNERVDPKTGEPSNAASDIYVVTFTTRKLPVEKISYEFKNPAANLKGIQVSAMADGTYSILFISPKNFEAMKKILENAGFKQSSFDLSHGLLSTNYGSSRNNDNFLNALTALKEEEALKQHGIPKIILELVTNDIKQRNALLFKPNTSPGK